MLPRALAFPPYAGSRNQDPLFEAQSFTRRIRDKFRKVANFSLTIRPSFQWGAHGYSGRSPRAVLIVELNFDIHMLT